jgi:hypothetical protein
LRHFFNQKEKRMKKLLAALALCVCLPSAAQAADYWKGIATNELGVFVFSLPQPDEESAMADAKARCSKANELDSGGECTFAIAAPNDWYLLGIYCSNGYDDAMVVKATKTNPDRSLAEATEEIGWFDPQNCWIAAESAPLPPIPESDDSEGDE